MTGVGGRLGRGGALLVGVAVTALAVASVAQAEVTRFVAGGTANSSYGTMPGDVSSNGRFLDFVQDGDGVGPEDQNGAADLFVRGRTTGSTEGIGVRVR